MKKLSVLIAICLFTITAHAQKVVYSEPDRDDSRQTEFDIIGKVNGNLLVYKALRSNHSIAVYDMNMKLKDKVKLDFLPDRIINADFLAYPDFCYLFYQYQKKNVVYAMAARLDGNGKLVGKEMEMDTTQISFLASNKIYSVVNSDDKQFISLFKINSKNEDHFVVTTLLYDKDLQMKQRARLDLDMPERHDFLTEFLVDNSGDFAFARAVQESEDDKAKSMELWVKKADSEVANAYPIQLKSVWLDDVRIKADNFNKHYIISSFFSKTRRGNIDGLYTCIWDKNVDSSTSIVLSVFDDGLRGIAKGDNGMKSAFNDYYLRNIIVRKDGGFLLAAESAFTTSRGGNGRYNNFYGSPFLRSMDYYSFGPWGYGFNDPWYRYNSFGQNIRYNAQNIAVFSFDNTGLTSWTNVIEKNQYDDETDAFIGYSMLNSGDQIHFVFNQQERRMQLLSAQSVSPDGKLTRNPTLKNLDQGYDFMAKYGKQVGLRQIIFPCMYRNYLCFARLDL